MVIALNMMDAAWEKGLHINVKALSRMLGITLVPTVALMGQGISQLFTTAVAAFGNMLSWVPPFAIVTAVVVRMAALVAGERAS